VWLLRSAILLGGMTDDGGVWPVDEEDGVPVALGGGSSVSHRTSVRSQWGRQKWRGS
jgi:hypothetical protein